MVDVGRELQERLQACEEQYMLHFADQVRLTRDRGILAALLAEAESVAAVALQYGDSLQQEAAQRQAVRYREEDARLQAAFAAAGPQGRAVALLTQRASLLMHQYTRHFAGQPRPSRDLGLLAELVASLEALAAELQPLHADQARGISDFAQLCRREQTAIEAARRVGSAAQQAAHYASAANTLMQTYVECCVERRRLAIRPQLLQRLLEQLLACIEPMLALRQAGLDLPYHAQSLTALGEQRRIWEAELSQLRAAWGRASIDERTEALTHELDEVLQAYNGLCDGAADAGGKNGSFKPALSGLCDRLAELEQQLMGCAASTTTPAHPAATEAQVARDALAMFAHRYDTGLPAAN
jgi:hypothetical protein